MLIRDLQMLAAVVRHIITTSKTRGGILIFLPGVQEIRQCMDMIEGVLPSSAPADILPLHANLSSEEQRRVFVKTTKWKIIAATNVAEVSGLRANVPYRRTERLPQTSITIDDVIYVLDSGKVKQTQYDGESGISRLVETWVTLAESRQRRGRAGRTQPGICYKLYTRKHESKMGKFVVPEILRVPLENISLAVKVTREDEDVKVSPFFLSTKHGTLISLLKHFLGKAISPPDVSSMDTAWATLENLGAVDGQGRLTALGRHLVRLSFSALVFFDAFSVATSGRFATSQSKSVLIRCFYLLLTRPFRCLFSAQSFGASVPYSLSLHVYHQNHCLLAHWRKEKKPRCRF